MKQRATFQVALPPSDQRPWMISISQPATQQLRQWLDQVANVRVHATTKRVVAEDLLGAVSTPERRCIGGPE
jgi:hypothetical protein